MSESRVRATALVLAVVALVCASGSAGALGDRPPGQIDIETDTTSLNVDVGSDGDAVWTVVYRIRLDDANTTEAFADLRQDIEANPATYLDPFEQRMQLTVGAAENATGREMTVRNASVETRREPQPQTTYGVVSYRIEWTNFATVEDGTIRAGDAIDQLFLESDTALRLRWPGGYALTGATPDPTQTASDEVVWRGQQDFDRGEPRIVLERQTETADGTTTAGSGDGGSDGGDGGGGETPTDGGLMPWLLAIVLGIGLLAGVALFVRRGGLGRDEASEAGAADATDTDGGGDGSDTAGTAAGAGGSSEENEADASEPPAELLSNEERMLQLLADNGGRMKQKQVAEELDWTAAKTSQVVGDLRDEDELESFRLGRENVLTLPDVDIDASREDE